MSVNKVLLLGFVGQDPVVKIFQSNSKGANFSVATSETYTNKTGEKVTNTEWHAIVVWGPLAEVVEKYVHKGTKLFLEGKLQTRKWTDQNNVDRYITEIVAQSIQLLDSKPNTGEQANNTHTSTESTGNTDEPETDDLPF